MLWQMTLLFFVCLRAKSAPTSVFQQDRPRALACNTSSTRGHVKTDRTLANHVKNTGPEASHTCYPFLKGGYIQGNSARCLCRLETDSQSGVHARWYKGDIVQTVAPDGVLFVTYNKSIPNQVYTCESVSPLMRKLGSTLTAKFAFFEPACVELAAPRSNPRLCDRSITSHQALVTCRVRREQVSPAPTFSFSLDGLQFEASQPGQVDGEYYQSQFPLCSHGGGEHRVRCRVTNTVINIRHDKTETVVFTEPPPLPPQVTIKCQAFHRVDSSNIVTLGEGYTGEATCSVRGGYPEARSTRLRCGRLVSSSSGNTATLRFGTGQLTREMDRAVCSCTSEHSSGCYSNNQSTVTLNVTYPPVVRFTHNSTHTKLSEGDSLEFVCSAKGNPVPHSLTLTRQIRVSGTRYTEELGQVQRAELTHTLGPLTCQDTGLYVCSGQNGQGTTSQEVRINIHCPSPAQQQRQTINLTPVVCDAFIGGDARISTAIYGFQEPKTLILRKRDDIGTNLTVSPRHTVTYTAMTALGVVTLEISDLVQDDFTNYTLQIVIDQRHDLLFTFYLNQVRATQLTEITGDKTPVDSSDSFIILIGVIIVSVVAASTIIGLAIIVILLVRRNHNQKETLDSRSLSVTDLETSRSRSSSFPYREMTDTLDPTWGNVRRWSHQLTY